MNIQTLPHPSCLIRLHGSLKHPAGSGRGIAFYCAAGGKARTLVGELTDALAEETGAGKVPVIAVAGHDTASAVAAVPALDQHFAYLSSGTWSLMGIETEEPLITQESYENNFTNEGGIEGTTRFLKNITGMWLLEQCRKEWEKAGRSYTYPEIVQMAEQAVPFIRFVNPDDPRFANPACMTKAIASYCEETGQPVPVTDAEFIRCIFESLALRYNEVIRMLKEMAPFRIDRLHVIGGGSKNTLLNQFTANAIGMPVIAGPSEATAIGNGDDTGTLGRYCLHPLGNAPVDSRIRSYGNIPATGRNELERSL